MDTDELSNETYDAILKTAERFNHDLTLQFGMLSYQCNDDDDYLNKALLLIQSWRKDIDGSIEEIFYDDIRPTRQQFLQVLESIENNIKKVQLIPMEKREFDF